MIICGIDPSSSKTGIAIFVDDQLKHTDSYKTSKKLTLPLNLCGYAEWLNKKFDTYRIDLVVVETAHSRILNVNTFKKIAYYESVSMLIPTMRGAEAIQLGAAQARKLALGNGRLSKDEACAQIDIRYPTWKFGSKDERDAVTLALAGQKGL